MAFKLSHLDTTTSATFNHWVLEHYTWWMDEGIIDANFNVFTDKATAVAKGGCVRKSIRLTGDDVTETSSPAIIEGAIRSDVHKVDGVDVDFTAAVDA